MAIESIKKADSTPAGKYARWSEEVIAAEKELDKFWNSGNLVVRRFLDERDSVERAMKKFNLFYTNVQILKSTLYSNLPDISVSRKFTDEKDDQARMGALILQRAIQQDMQEEECGFANVMRYSISDRLIPGVGTAWLRLVTETEDQPNQTDEEGEPLQMISKQAVAMDYVYWMDLVWSPCRVWEERRWVGRKVYLARDQCVERFGEVKGGKIPLNNKQRNKGNSATNDQTPENMVMDRACIYEIWDRETKTVVWFSKDMPALLDEKPDPLGLEGFEPCPKPMFANLTTSRCVPKSDYAMIQDQYSELDTVNNRISLLIRACKVVGVYDKSADGIQRMLKEGTDNALIPVDNWAMFAEKGGIRGQVDWLPLDTVVKALEQLLRNREAIKQQIYELTGISDIVRGNTRASETLGAQEIKANFANVRLQVLQDEVTRFGEDVLKIKAGIIVNHFTPMHIAKLANTAHLHDEPGLISAGLALVKSGGDELLWRVKIEAGSMAIIDQDKEKSERNEFMNAVATFLQSAASVGEATPELIPLMLKMLQFGVAGYNISTTMEGIFDRYIEEFEAQIAKQKANPPPDPNQAKMEMEAKQMQMEQDLKREDAQLSAESKRQDRANDQRKADQELEQSQKEFTQKMRQSIQEFSLKMEQMKKEGELKTKQANEAKSNAD